MPFRPMKCRDAKKTLKNLGFKPEANKGGSHTKWRATIRGKLRKVTLDCHNGEVRPIDVKSMIGQAGVTKKQWYDAL